jgi:archaemetzincin
MNRIALVPLGNVARKQMELLAEELTSSLRAPCFVSADGLNIEFAYDPLRGQYHSTAIIGRLRKTSAAENSRLLGVGEVDLFVPIFTFVFGEAQLGPASATAAIVSAHRLRQEFYGLPADDPLLSARLLKEAMHEIGHTLGLRHCRDYRCVMSSSPAVENIDLKDSRFCTSCEERLEWSDDLASALKEG